jgi:predicted nucleic acid-binding protein
MKRVSYFGLGGCDATILVCMKKAGITSLVTHEQVFRQTKDITVIDPIALDSMDSS